MIASAVSPRAFRRRTLVICDDLGFGPLNDVGAQLGG
jgi:hypothetical protein